MARIGIDPNDDSNDAQFEPDRNEEVQPQGTPFQVLRFRYTNWRGAAHTYAIVPEGTSYEKLATTGDSRWMLHGHVITRDGDPRQEMGSNRRRSFAIAGMTEISEWVI